MINHKEIIKLVRKAQVQYFCFLWGAGVWVIEMLCHFGANHRLHFHSHAHLLSNKYSIPTANYFKLFGLMHG